MPKHKDSYKVGPYRQGKYGVYRWNNITQHWTFVKASRKNKDRFWDYPLEVISDTQAVFAVGEVIDYDKTDHKRYLFSWITKQELREFILKGYLC